MVLVEVFVVGAALKKKRKKKMPGQKKNLPGMVVVGFSVIGARGTRY
jgi:hypothetical protein